MPLGMELGLGPGDAVSDGVAVPPPLKVAQPPVEDRSSNAINVTCRSSAVVNASDRTRSMAVSVECCFRRCSELMLYHCGVSMTNKDGINIMLNEMWKSI